MPNSDVESSVTRHQLDDWLRKALGLPVGTSPFPWQHELLRRLIEGNMPRAVDVPTGLGKTAVMAIWLVARAAGADVPRRLIYVVDRRAVVDQATSVAEGLRELVDTDAALKEALQLQRPLPISTLRGQFVDNKEWLQDPAAPAIVLGTVDMVGSRLLFSGYGVSHKMRPYHAGLLGADSLIVLDEAHLVPPFERLIEQIAKGIDATGHSLRPQVSPNAVPSLHFLSLSATGRDRRGDETLRLGGDDRRHDVVKKRLSAKKQLLLRSAVADRDLPETLASEAWALSKEGQSPARIIVFCTSRDQAGKVQELLQKGASKENRIEVELFVGGRRVYEREAAAKWLHSHGFIAGSQEKPERATFVIATAAGEVGVDLDADHAVCDLVSWERMVQRFGRVNRRGDGDAAVIVVPTAHDAKTEATLEKFARWQKWVEDSAGATTDAVPAANADDAEDEGESPEAATSDEGGAGKAPKLKPEEKRAAERALRHDAVRDLIHHLRRAGSDAYDVSPDGILELRARADEDPSLKDLIGRATTPAPLHPPLSRALVEAWSMTSLEEHTGRPEVAPWIRGWPDEEEGPQTTVVWRTHLPITDSGGMLDDKALESFRDAADPHIAERLETETWRAAEWLAKRAKALKPAKSDDVPLQRELRPLQSGDVLAVMLDGRDGECRVVSAQDFSSKDKRTALERTLAGAILLADRRVGGLRGGLLSEDADEEVVDVTEVGAERRVVPFRVRRVAPEDFGAIPEGWRIEAQIPVSKSDDGENAWLSIESLTDAMAQSEEGRSGAKQAQLLHDHQDWAEREARRLARALRLPEVYADALAAAASLHDEGKAADRWQRAFGAPVGNGNPAYAKTITKPNLSLLEGYRHELGSLPRAEASERLAPLPPELRELILHLIAAHHGHARPLIRTTGAPEPPTRLVERAREVARRFAALEKRWGPWGLAWWEALLRSADQQASRRNDLEGGSHG